MPASSTRSPRMYDVPLMVARGYASLSFLHSAAEYINDLEVPAYIYHLGDFDPSGVNAGEKIEETLREMAPDAEIHFERIAVTPEQIGEWDLPTRPTKATDTRSKGFGDISVELDAIEPDQLARRSCRARSSSTCPPSSSRSSRPPRKAKRTSSRAWCATSQQVPNEELNPSPRTGRASRQDRCAIARKPPPRCAGADRVRQNDRRRTSAAASSGRWPSRHHHGAGPKPRRSDGREAIRRGRHRRRRHPGFSPMTNSARPIQVATRRAFSAGRSPTLTRFSSTKSTSGSRSTPSS